MHIPKAQEIYRHFKGNLYQIVTLARHSETGEELVIYQALYGDFSVYARPLPMFAEKVDRIKYPQETQEYRFELQDAAALQAADETNKAAAHEGVNGGVDEGADGVVNLDPLVTEFLDAADYGERLNILAALHHRITDDMISVMSMATDIEVASGDIEQRYTELRECLLKLQKYECNRLH